MPGFTDQVLNHFPAKTRQELLEFNKHVASLDADYLIFMARKALRIHDLLVFARGEEPPIPVYSDQVLEQSLDRFEGKTVALIDDTLFLGTTLGKAKFNLENVGATKVSTHIFGLNTKYWVKDLVDPDYVRIEMSQQEMLTFCAQEVRALAQNGFPYLTDFPIFRPIKFPPEKIELLEGIKDWRIIEVTNQWLHGQDARVFTFLPTSEFMRDFAVSLNCKAENLIDILKVRLFTQTRNSPYWSRIVPIATIRPMADFDAPRLLKHLSKNIFVTGQDDHLTVILHHINTPKAQAHLCQYILSALLGRHFAKEFATVFSTQGQPSFNLNEAIRHFGSWLKPTLNAIHQSSTSIDDSHNDAYTKPLSQQSPFKLKAAEQVKSKVLELAHSIPNKPISQDERNSAWDADEAKKMWELSDSFLHMYKEVELPYRIEVQKAGRRIFEDKESYSAGADRLGIGYPWSWLSEKLIPQNLSRSEGRLNVASLYMDCLIDQGVAVPILCYRDGLLFRGYRHGEDVTITERENSLIYGMIDRFLRQAKRDYIPRLALEKLLSVFIRGGWNLKILYANNETRHDGDTVRVGYYIHGVRPFFSESDAHFANRDDALLSTRLMEIGVLKSESANSQITLGEMREAPEIDETAALLTHHLGWLIGTLYSAKDQNGKRILDDDAFSMFASCTTVFDVCGALLAEIKIIDNQLRTNLRRVVNQVRLNNDESLINGIDQIRKSTARTALNSGLRKLKSHHTSEPGKIFKQCKEYLQNMENGEFLVESWERWWSSISDPKNIGKADQFEDVIEELTSDLFDLSLTFAEIEFDLEASLLRNNPKTKRKLFASLEFVERIGTYVRPHTKDQELKLDQLRGLASGEIAWPEPLRRAQSALKFFHDDIRPHLVNRYEAIDKMMEEYGQNRQRTSYNIVAWYDIIDSTGKKAGLRGEEYKEYEWRVDSFKRTINNFAHKQLLQARDSGDGQVKIPVTDDSRDDEKHIFYAGKHQDKRLRKILTQLLATAKKSGIAIRLAAMRTSNFSPRPHSLRSNDTVISNEFWHHFKEVKRELRALENDASYNSRGNPQLFSHVWIVGRELADNLKLDRHLKPEESKRALFEFTTQTGESQFDHQVVGHIQQTGRRQAL